MNKNFAEYFEVARDIDRHIVAVDNGSRDYGGSFDGQVVTTYKKIFNAYKAEGKSSEKAHDLTYESDRLENVVLRHVEDPDEARKQLDRIIRENKLQELE